LPALARAIVAFQRKKCSVTTGVSREVSFVQLKGDGINCIVRGDDWSKLVPYLTDGTLDPYAFPVNEIYEMYPQVQFDPAVADIRDREYYERILGVLEKIFVVEFPTSDL
jgi:hypothetical protein